MAKQRRRKPRSVSKVVAAIELLEASLGPVRPGRFQDLAGGLAANGCSIKDLQEAAIFLDERLLWEQQISEILTRMAMRGKADYSICDGVTYKELLTRAAASGDQQAQALLDAGVPQVLG